MPATTVNGLSIAYEVIGERGPAWILTPGGRFSKDYGGVRELATAIADAGNRVVIWDRPNTGESDVTFDGPSESVVQADALGGLLRALGLGPTRIVGGSGGSRVSIIAAGRHPELAKGLAVWWISGGALGLVALGFHYCSDSIRAAWQGGMEAVVELPEWSEVLERNRGNRDRMLAMDPKEFIAALERWMVAYCPCGDELVPGLTATEQAALALPTLVFRSGESDMNHPRTTSETIAAALPNAELVEPPWGDREWMERQAARGTDGTPLFTRWPLLAPQLLEWSARLD